MTCLDNKKLTIVCPTRARPESLKHFLDSIMLNTANFSNFEIVFIHDDDDAATAKALSEYKNQYAEMEMYIHHRPQHFNLSDAYYSWAWREGYLHGDYFWAAQDDIVILTKDWNNKIIQAIESYLADKPDRICCAFALDINNAWSFPHDPWGWYPIVTREAVEVVRYIYPWYCPTHASEIWLRELYRAADRYLPILNVEIEQVSYRTHKDVPKDDVGKSMETRAKKYEYMAKSFLQYSRNVTGLKHAIYNKRQRGD